MHQGETSALESRVKWWWCGVGGGELWDLTFIPYLESKMLVLLLYMTVWWKETKDPSLLPIICVALDRSLSPFSVSVCSSGTWRQYNGQTLWASPSFSPRSFVLHLEHVSEPPIRLVKRQIAGPHLQGF